MSLNEPCKAGIPAIELGHEAPGRARPAHHVGAAGAILGLACFLPELCSDLYTAWRAGDSSGAKDIHLSVLTASRKIVAELGPAGVKYAMDRVGYFGGPPRPPLLPLAEAQKQTVDSALGPLLPA